MANRIIITNTELINIEQIKNNNHDIIVSITWIINKKKNTTKKYHILHAIAINKY